MTLTKTHKAAIAGSAGVIACCIAFTPTWEGMDSVAKPDAIGTGHPITYCYGQTSEFGQVKVGQRFTKKECDEKLKESIETIYLPEVSACVHVPVPDKVMASLVDAGYNAGTARVCHSPMVAKINRGDIRDGCNAFNGWIITSDHVVRTGLIDRRAGELHGDHRLSERALCLEGLSEGITPPPAPQPAPQPAPTQIGWDVPWWARLLHSLLKLIGGN